MKKLTVASAVTLLLLSMNVVADPHVDEAITLTTAAIEQGKAGKLLKFGEPMPGQHWNTRWQPR